MGDLLTSQSGKGASTNVTVLQSAQTPERQLRSVSNVGGGSTRFRDFSHSRGALLPEEPHLESGVPVSGRSHSIQARGGSVLVNEGAVMLESLKKKRETEL